MNETRIIYCYQLQYIDTDESWNAMLTAACVTAQV